MSPSLHLWSHYWVYFNNRSPYTFQLSVWHHWTRQLLHRSQISIPQSPFPFQSPSRMALQRRDTVAMASKRAKSASRSLALVMNLKKELQIHHLQKRNHHPIADCVLAPSLLSWCTIPLHLRPPRRRRTRERRRAPSTEAPPTWDDHRDSEHQSHLNHQ